MLDPLEAAFEANDDPAWQELMGKVEEQLPVKPLVEPSDVLALFSTPLGETVLRALYMSFVNVTIVEPGQPPEVHGIRQGQANVVHWILDQMARAERED